jgi:hypothetical protein
MKTMSLWVIRIALTVQFLGALAVPALIAGAESPRGTWMAEWVRPAATARTIGVLSLRDAKLSFAEQSGQAEWALDLANVKRVSAVNGGRSLAIVSVSGEEFIFTVMDANLVQGSPKKALAILERAVQLFANNGL